MPSRSAKNAASDKRLLHEALDDMRANASDPQRVYSCLVQIFGILAAAAASSQSQAEALVNAAVSPATTVAFLQEIMRLHLSQEEIQWYLCRILALASTNSLRFQCQAGQLTLWSDVFHVRSTHPKSMRVLETSLQLYEALLRGNEFHLLQAKPAQQLIQELLASIDRFSATTTGHGVCEAFRPEMVIGAVRVLATIYASPRLQSLIEEKNDRFASAIVTRLVSTFSPVFVKSDELERVQLWLRMCRLQIQQHHSIAIPALFLSTDSALSSATPWFILLLDSWSNSPAIIYDLLAIFTLVFALPHQLGDEQLDALAHELLDKHKLLGTLCGLLAKYSDKLEQKQQTSAGQDGALVVLTMLEIIRVLRQWSAIETASKCYSACPQVKTLLIPTLLSRLQTSAEQIQSSPTTKQQPLQTMLEILILLQNLLQLSASIKNSLASSKTLYSTVRQLSRERTSAASASDTDLDALVQREAAKLSKLLVGTDLQSAKSSSAKKTAASRHQQPSARSLLVLPANSGSTSSSRVSTRQLSSSSSSVAAHALRASCSTTKI